MTRRPEGPLRRGWTTGACATAATRAALLRLWGGAFPDTVQITLPKGETPVFAVAHRAAGEGWAEAGITKDAGDDPDVTHGALIVVRVSASDGGVLFRAGEGVGTVTRAGLPVAVGEPAINPVPRQMMTAEVMALASQHGQSPDVTITVGIPGGAAIALKTWNPRLGIVGGLSVLGTTGVVRPFSCAAWIASIHRGIDVARAAGLTHVAGCTGATSEATVQALHGLPDHAMLDMGDFAGGMLKYLARHPVPHVTIGGGIGKMTKLAQGAMDLHSGRSQVDFAALADLSGHAAVAGANTALQALEIAGTPLAQAVADRALQVVTRQFGDRMTFDTVVIDRAGAILARAGG
ncbi:cobalt-precorrin-5B (C1)-methyltransferase [Loktanella atrilutea]|uniref:Cobalt-precorrin-5B C(1)-methyltransferase n=1 Tax=Loktanella atrilutea TaxID=366533 RepID=A0A1M4TK85_LOKAT|nr:cobalt-precorrin-5B (C(1))-methyltransferase [Loktanella atrilutea]SHE44805.1 cobalt-precorrin-5B (C1)-methyltransferase [Loktanella atrilutea]